jgi:hypothetical protein
MTTPLTLDHCGLSRATTEGEAFGFHTAPAQHRPPEDEEMTTMGKPSASDSTAPQQKSCRCSSGSLDGFHPAPHSHRRQATNTGLPVNDDY